MNTRKSPCAQCPWRKDIPTGQFPANRYDELRDTTGEAGNEAAPDAPLFGCHKSTEDDPMPCAGWLAAVGFESIAVRLQVAAGRIPPEALRPGEDWPPLHSSYEEMAEAQGGARGVLSVCMNERCRDFAREQTVVPGHPCPSCSQVVVESLRLDPKSELEA